MTYIFVYFLHRIPGAGFKEGLGHRAYTVLSVSGKIRGSFRSR